MFKGIVQYFKSSIAFKDQAITSDSDAGVLWAVSRGLASATGVSGGSKNRAAGQWSTFFRSVRGGAPVSLLKQQWGKAEFAGVRFGLSLVNGMTFSGSESDARYRRSLWNVFVHIGDSYRRALARGTRIPMPLLPDWKSPDPRHDGGFTNRNATLVEYKYGTCVNPRMYTPWWSPSQPGCDAATLLIIERYYGG